MTGIFILILILAALTELVKGLSANGTPPFLQKFSWQMDLAYFMWSYIKLFRIAFAMLLVTVGFAALPQMGAGAIILALVILAIWGGIYWLFNHYWVGRVKFLPITQKTFVKAKDNEIDLDMMVIGVNEGGVQKAYPAPMLFYHHALSDEIAGQPILATYCGMCRSGRVYDRMIDGQAPDFLLVGAITFNAVLRDSITNTWWRQETGEAAKGALQGRYLEDVAFEQMSLRDWIAKYPKTDILQYDPTFAPKYNFFHKLLNYEASLPGWHRQDTPRIIIGVDIDGAETAYDFEELQKRDLVLDQVGDTPVLVFAASDGQAGLVYDRRVGKTVLEFTRDGDTLIDAQTGSKWDKFGRCTSGKHKGKALAQIQSYQQFIRAWISFHPETSFYEF